MRRQVGILFAVLLLLLGSAAQASEGSGFTELRLTRAELLAELSARNPAVAEALAAVRALALLQPQVPRCCLQRPIGRLPRRLGWRIGVGRHCYFPSAIRHCHQSDSHSQCGLT
jgi:hypothetical protein